MSSPPLDAPTASVAQIEDDPMEGSAQGDDEGEGDDTMGRISDDSSEEPEEDEEEAKRIREGFIVDEDEEEELETDEEKRRERKRRKKHHRRRRDEEPDGGDALEDDDLELLEENTGASFKNRLTRLRRGRHSVSPVPSSSKRRVVVESSDDDLDDGLDLPQVQDIQRIWDDDRVGPGRDEDEDLDDMDNFIDYDEEEDGTGAMDEKVREERRQERQREKERRRAMGTRPELAGIDANAWDEIHGVFGDGHEYDWALEGDEDTQYDEEPLKPEMKYQDVFEPSEIRARLLTDDDDLIRAQDIPERMQLANSSLSQSSTLSLHRSLTEADINEASFWVTPRLSHRKSREFFHVDGPHWRLQTELVEAVQNALRYLFIQEFEVPYIWTHKRDYISHFDVNDLRARVELLSLPELWRIYALGQKYRSLLDRRKALGASYDRLGLNDEYYEQEIRPKLDTVELVTDATAWLAMKYKDKKQDDFEFHFHDDEEQPETKKRKKPSRISAYEVAKKSVVSKLAQGFGIQPAEIVRNFVASDHAHFVEDQDLNPIVYAEQFTDPDTSKAQAPEELLRRARMILSTELGRDPLLRQEMRNTFKENALVSVLPTEKGKVKIDEHHLYFNFKYLFQKHVKDLIETPQFLHIVAAEADHLITVSITLPLDAKSTFERRLNEAFSSDGFSETTKSWNQQRTLVIQETLEQYLLPVGLKWTWEWIREEAEDFLASRCGEHLRERIDVAPYFRSDMRTDDVPSVLVVSWGKGDPQKDAITLVFLDEAGRLREHTKIDNLVDSELRDEFTDLLKRRRPDVIVVGGFTMATTKLAQRVKEIVGVRQPRQPESQGWGNEPPLPPPPSNDQAFDIPIIYVFDEVARIYQHSKRAADEFSALSPTAKYCVGLARYTQSPLNEYAALGSDITAISFDEDDQHLVPKDKLLAALERALVDVVNKVGVDVNRAVTDSYYYHLLPFVCGLGPRKAQVLVKKIGSMGGNIINREQFIKGGLLTTKIFLNAAGFLRIPNEDTKPTKNRHTEDDVQDPLDATRIHPEDYELARKMATDALELDEEDVHDEHPSYVVSLIMQDTENEKKLNELNLDEFAVNMFETNQDRKRHTLHVIREELLKPFAEQRLSFPSLGPWDVLTMLSGETPRTLRVGLIVSVLVLRTKDHFVSVRLDSGIEGVINSAYLADQIPTRPDDVVKKGQTIPGVVIDVKLDLAQDQFFVELSSRPADVAAGDSAFRIVRHDEAWSHSQFEYDQQIQKRKKMSEVDRTRRVIKHPNFHNFNTAQSEAYLDKQQRGDVVIRPSSKGPEHLAVTWKVDEKLYQHIDVTEPNADPTGQTIGSQLIVDANHTYADLDELIVNHVQAMSRRVEELMAHEKFKQGSEDDLHIFLKNFVAANPAKSMYGFTLNRRRPGHFNLCFLANKNSPVQTWPVRVSPEAYYLFDAPAVGVPELCDAFKVRHLHESQNIGGGAGGKTPFGAGGRTPARTPARTPGHVTPGHMSVRQLGRTPNAYAPVTPGYGAVPQTPYGYQTPSGYPPRPSNFPQQPPTGPAGMNPARAAMIQNSGAWNQGGAGWG